MFTIGQGLLKIRDQTSNSKQPIKIKSRWVITFNGEIYSVNDSEIDRYLKINSNNEINAIRQVFMRYGDKGVHFLNGMFAMCIYDKNDQSITLARDKSGQKPLYYANFKDLAGTNIFIWASELSTIASSYKREFTLNVNQLKSFVSVGFNLNSETLIDQVKQVSPGQFLKFNRLGELIEVGDLTAQTSDVFEFKSFTEVFNFTVNRHLLADTPLALSLSGGLDSSILAATALKMDVKIKAYSTYFENSPDKYNWDFSRSKRLSSELGIEFKKVSISKSTYLENMFTAHDYLDEPLYNQSLPTYLELIQMVGLMGDNKRVLITGSGGDELFTGYPHHLKYNNQIKLIKILGKKAYSYLYRIKNQAHPSLNAADFWLRTKLLQVPSELLNPCLKIAPFSPTNEYNSNRKNLQELLELDFNWLVSDNFQYLDRFGMRNNLEARSPFADSYLRNWCHMNLRQKDLIYGQTQKYLLLNLSRTILPSWFTSSFKKSGWASPISFWYEESDLIRKKYYETFSDYSSRSSNELINWKLLCKVLENNRKYPGKWLNMLYSLAVNSMKLGTVI
jgi:asparagine synthase (glutamine-hydrolysing)